MTRRRPCGYLYHQSTEVWRRLPAGLLALGSSAVRRPSPRVFPGSDRPEGLLEPNRIPDYSGGTATDSHRVPGCCKTFNVSILFSTYGKTAALSSLRDTGAGLGHQARAKFCSQNRHCRWRGPYFPTSTPHISLAYSATVRSLENLPIRATFRIDLRAQVRWSRKARSTSSWQRR